MARNDYMQEPVEMRALAAWSGREGKVRRNDRITVPEWRARELEGYTRTSSRKMNIDGTTTEAGQPTMVRARAVRVRHRDETEDKGGPTPSDRRGHTPKQRPENDRDETKRRDSEGDHKRDSSGGATAGAQARAQELGVDVEDVEGSGASGRVTKPDVEEHHRRHGPKQPGTGDPQLDRFTADLRECTADQLREQRELYAQANDQRFVEAVDAEIARRGPGDHGGSR